TETPMLYKVPLILTPQPEGGFTVTSPVLPELVSEGDTAEEAVDNARDALTAVVEAYQDLGRALPPNVQIADANGPVWVETLVTAPRPPGMRHASPRHLAGRNCRGRAHARIASR